MAGAKLTRNIGQALTEHGEDEIFALYLKHGSVRKLLKNMPEHIKAMTRSDHGQMSMAVYYDWLKQTPERQAKWEMIKEVMANKWAEEALEIVDSTDVDEVQVARLRANTRQWLAEKFNRHQYGKPDVNVAVGIQVGDEFLSSLKEVEKLAKQRAEKAKELAVEPVEAEFEVVE